jgi:hypothetical protein
MDVP